MIPIPLCSAIECPILATFSYRKVWESATSIGATSGTTFVR